MSQNTRRIELVIATSRLRPAASAAEEGGRAFHLNTLIIRDIFRSSVADG
jgi:hypothetical protein